MDMKTIEQLKQEVRDTKLPEEIKEVFYNVLETADVASLSERDRARYEANLKFYRDTMWELRDMREEGWKVGHEVGHEEGRKEGRQEKTLEFASFLKADGHSVEYIARATGLSISEIEKI